MCCLERQPQFVLKAKQISLLMKSDIRGLTLWKALPWCCGAGPGGSTRATRHGRGPWDHQGGVMPSLPDQSHPADTSKARRDRIGTVTRVSHSLAIPRRREAHPSQYGSPWNGMGTGSGQHPAQRGPGPGKDKAAAPGLHIKEVLITK